MNVFSLHNVVKLGICVSFVCYIVISVQRVMRKVVIMCFKK